MNEKDSLDFRIAKLMNYTIYVLCTVVAPIVCCFVCDIHIVIGVIYLIVVGFPLCVIGYDLIIEAKEW